MFFIFVLLRSCFDLNIYNSILFVVYEEIDKFYYYCNFYIENNIIYL